MTFKNKWDSLPTELKAKIKNFASNANSSHKYYITGFIDGVYATRAIDDSQRRFCRAIISDESMQKRVLEQ